MEMDSLRLKLNHWQDDFVFTDVENVALFNEFGSGKTSAGIIKMQMLMNNYPKNVGVVLRNIYDELIKATIPQYFELVFGDRNYVPDSVYYNMSDKHLRFENGSEIWFMALDNIKSIRKLKNMVIGALWADQGEEIDQEIWTMACGRVRLKNVPLIKFITGNAEGGDHWAKNMYYNKALDIQQGFIDDVNCEWGYWQGLNENYLGIMAKPKVNEPNLPKGYYENLKKLYPREWILKYVYSQWTGKTGMIYPFSDKNIIYDPWFKLNTLPRFAQVAYAQDYGISDTSPMVWLTIVKYDEKYYVINEYYEYEQGIDAVNDYVDSLNAIRNNKLEFVVGCPKTFQREGTSKGRTPANLFKMKVQAYPVPFETRQPLLAKLIEDDRFFVYSDCVNTIKEFKNYKWRNFKTADNHAIEAIERAIHKFENVKDFDYKQLNNIPAGL